MMRIGIAVILTSMLSASTSFAQTLQYNFSQNTPDTTQIYGSEPTLRVQVNFRVPLQPTSNDNTADAAMMEAARKALYSQAQRECAILSEQFNNAECRLGNLNIQLNTFIVPTNPQPPQLVAVATYLLKVR